MLHIYIIQIQNNFANTNLDSPYVFSYPSPTKHWAIGLNFLHFDLSTYPSCQHKHKTLHHSLMSSLVKYLYGK
jgi:hypothetical protein